MSVTTKKVLVIDDDAIARQIINAVLRKRGADVLMAADAMGALTMAQKHKPDLIILDLGLPAGGGFSVLQRLKMFPALSLIPVVVISGLDRGENEPLAIAAGAAEYIEKPASPEQLGELIDRFLATKE